MQIKPLETSDGRRSFAVILEPEDEAIQAIRKVADEYRIDGAYVTAIGAFSDVTLGFWDQTKKIYHRIAVHEQVELLSLSGNIAMGPDGARQIHAHVVIGKRDGTAHGGHLLEALVRPTMEMIITEVPKHLQRQSDEQTGLPLLDLTL
jgi:uncharacterized protein